MAMVLRRMMRLAAEQGHAKAQFNLASMYDNGKGVEQDYASAFQFYRLAAEQGHVKAQYNLAVIYYLGEGVAQDDVAAHMWATIATQNGDEKASILRNNVAEKMSKADIARAEEMARACIDSGYENCRS